MVCLQLFGKGNLNLNMKSTASPSARSVEKQISAFIGKFEPAVAKVIRGCRAELRKILPMANELIYDNYNFFVIGYTTTDRASDCIVSIAGAANGVILSFYQGASLRDPKGILLGSGKQNRFIRLGDPKLLRSRDVLELMRAAVAEAKTPFSRDAQRRTIIKSISAKQRPRRKQ
jgi:hypothetical protein